MVYEKKGVPALAVQETPDKVTSNTAIIPQDGRKMQEENTGKAKGRGKRVPHLLNANQKTYSLAIKCYDEQLCDPALRPKPGQPVPYMRQELVDRISKLDPAKYEVIAIEHDRDTVSDGIWAVAKVKRHYHIIVRLTIDRDRIQVSTLLDMLGVHFVPGLDDELWMNRGVETVGNFAGYAMYLTHETEEAILEAKELYDVSELITNLTPEGVQRVREGYRRVSAHRRVTPEDLVALDKEAYALGHDFKDFDGWYAGQPFSVRSHAKMKTIKESYDRGVDARIKEQREITRLCVFIQGPHGTGKSFATNKALLGKRVLPVGGGGTGRFDNLRPDHEAIVIDDDVCPNLLSMADNYACRAYRRRSDNPVWAGRYLIVTSNLSFIDWVEKCGIAVRDGRGQPTEHYTAALSRFYVCKMVPDGGHFRLSMVSPSMRGSAATIAERHDMFEWFASRFNAVAAMYEPSKEDIDVEAIARGPYSAYWDKEAEAYERHLAEQAERLENKVQARLDAISWEESRPAMPLGDIQEATEKWAKAGVTYDPSTDRNY